MAILLVVLYHADVPWMSGGFLGVDVFFALSGYLITGLLWSEIKETGRVDLARFYARRARRLLPASAVTMAFTLASCWLLLSPLEQASYTGAAVASALYASNVWFGLNATDYVAAPPHHNPFLHLWSLAVEEQFYVAWPALVLLCWRRARQSPLIATQVTIAITLALTVWLQRTGASPWAFFGSPGRAWEFGVGAVGAVVAWTLPNWTAWVGVLAILVPAVAYGPTTTFPGLSAIPPVVGTVAILMARDPVTTRILSTRVMQHLGSLSYGWYLWHWPCVVLAKVVWPALSVWGALGASAVALAASTVSFRFVESPIRHAAWLQSRTRLTLVGAGTLTLGLLVTVLAWRTGVSRGMEDPSQVPFAAARADEPAIYRSRCHIGMTDVAIPRCVFGAVPGSRHVVLWGDSHAAQWFPALERAATEKGWRLTVITKSGCPAADIGGHPSCRSWWHRAVERVKSERPDMLVIANASVYLNATDSRLAVVSAASFLAAQRRTLDAVSGTPTTVLLSPPSPGFDVPMCLAREAWRPWQGAECTFARRPQATAALEYEAARDRPAVKVVDVSDILCEADHCAPMRDGIVVYRDDNHLTARFSAAMSPALVARLH